MKKTLALFLTFTLVAGIAGFVYADDGQAYPPLFLVDIANLTAATPSVTDPPAQPSSPEPSEPELEPAQPESSEMEPQPVDPPSLGPAPEQPESKSGRIGRKPPRNTDIGSDPWWKNIPSGDLFKPDSVSVAVSRISSSEENNVGETGVNDAADPAPTASSFSAATPSVTSKVKDVAPGSVIGGHGTRVRLNGSAINYIDDLDVEPGDELLIYFEPEFFTWEDGGSHSGELVTLSSIRGKVSLRYTNTKNSKVFDKIELSSKNGEAVIRVTFTDPLPIRNSLDFRTILYLVAGGSRHYASEAELSGAIANIEEEVDNSYEDLDLSDGTVYVATEAIRRIRLYLGEGVYVNARNIRKNAKFYGVAVLDEYSRNDDEITDEYPDIVDLYSIHSFGLNSAGNTVEFEDAPPNYYVYNSSLEYLGRSHQKLDFASKYYLAAKELAIPSVMEDNDVPDIPIEDLEPIEVPENENANPYTGH